MAALSRGRAGAFGWLPWGCRFRAREAPEPKGKRGPSSSVEPMGAGGAGWRARQSLLKEFPCLSLGSCLVFKASTATPGMPGALGAPSPLLEKPRQLSKATAESLGGVSGPPSRDSAACGAPRPACCFPSSWAPQEMAWLAGLACLGTLPFAELGWLSS